MKQTNNFYPKTWLKKFWNITISWEAGSKNWTEYVLTDERGCLDDIIVETNRRYRVLNVYRKGMESKFNRWLLISLRKHLKKWGLIAR